MGETRDIDLKNVFSTLRERWWIVVGCAILAAAVAFVYFSTREPLYRATAVVMIEKTNLDQALFGSRVFDSSDQDRSLRTGAALVKTDTVAKMVKEQLGSARSTGQLLKMLSVTPSPVTDMISIAAVSVIPQEASDVANAFVEQFILSRQVSDRAALSAAREKIATELAGMTPQALNSERGRTLQQKYEELGILEAMQTGGYIPVQKAGLPNSAFSPRIVMNTGVAGVAGLVLGLIVAFLLQYLDRRIKDEDTLEATIGAPVLARIPRVGRQWKHAQHTSGEGIVGFADPGTPLLEAFRSLRSNLQFFEADKPLKTIMITSAMPREGKSITTINLALALALSGSRVSVVEADLRRPRLDVYLDIDYRTGLSTYLAGGAQLSAVTQPIRSQQFLPTSRPQLPNGTENHTAVSPALEIVCIASGPLPPNPAELLGSSQMTALLAHLRTASDYVLVDVPPVLAVSDALVLAPRVDAVLVTARLFSTTLDDAREMRNQLSRAGARVIGIVVQDVPRPRGYYERYGGYTADV